MMHGSTKIKYQYSVQESSYGARIHNQ